MPTAKYPNRKRMKRIQQRTSVQPLEVQTQRGMLVTEEGQTHRVMLVMEEEDRHTE